MNKLLLLGIVLAGCGGKKEGGGEAPPAQPPHGAPVAFVAKSVTPGDNHSGSIDVKAYNFSDKRVAQYWLLMRYTDAAGAALKVKPGTPFEGDTDHFSLSGKKFLCEPKSWCSFKIDHLDVPAKAAKAEVIAKSLTALKSDGMTFEEAPLFEYQGMDWPSAAPAKP